MLTREQAAAILRTLDTLPDEKLAEACDFILFLKEHYGIPKAVEESSDWTDEDLYDLTTAVLRHADQTL